MKKLIQRVFDINPGIVSDPIRLQRFLEDQSKDNWEYCGQMGLYFVFKRWEEEPNVVNGGSSSFRQESNNYFGQYNNRPTYQPQAQSPSYQPYSGYNSHNNYNRYNPSQFGIPVKDDEDNKYSSNPFNESPHE